MAYIKSGKNKGKQCPNPATKGDKCGVHSPKKKQLPALLMKIVTGCHPREGEDEEVTEEVAAVEDKGNNNNEQPHLCMETVAPRVRSGCSVDRFAGVMPVNNGTYVCNVTGSSKDKGNWKRFCARYLATVGEEYPKVCRVKDCQRKVTATGHMYWRDCKGVPPEGTWRYNYLVGICSHHNSAVYDTKYVPLKKGYAVKIEENPVVPRVQARQKKK